MKFQTHETFGLQTASVRRVPYIAACQAGPQTHSREVKLSSTLVNFTVATCCTLAIDHDHSCLSSNTDWPPFHPTIAPASPHSQCLSTRRWSSTSPCWRTTPTAFACSPSSIRAFGNSTRRRRPASGQVTIPASIVLQGLHSHGRQLACILNGPAVVLRVQPAPGPHKHLEPPRTLLKLLTSIMQLRKSTSATTPSTGRS